VKKLFATLAIILGTIGVFAIPVVTVSAFDCVTNPTATGCPCQINPSASVCSDLTNPNKDKALSDTFANIINILLYIAGIIAIIMIIISGIRMITSRGTPGDVTKARNTLLYSIAGLVVAVSAYAIVNFVLAKL
jgi:hypothetical protein